tara:strand:- start:228 stop:467 length:240 start_codon:yes stop_codon:yes gene_type:complete
MIREETSQRICNHMNKDHMDAVHGYLKNYTEVKDFEEVELCEITSKYMKIKYDGKFTEINFPKEITEQEIKSTLVSMIL